MALKPSDGDQLVVFADSKCGPKDGAKRRSHTGIMFKFGTAPIFTITKTGNGVMDFLQGKV